MDKSTQHHFPASLPDCPCPYSHNLGGGHSSPPACRARLSLPKPPTCQEGRGQPLVPCVYAALRKEQLKLQFFRGKEKKQQPKTTTNHTLTKLEHRFKAQRSPSVGQGGVRTVAGGLGLSGGRRGRICSSSSSPRAWRQATSRKLSSSPSPSSELCNLTSPKKPGAGRHSPLQATT